MVIETFSLVSGLVSCDFTRLPDVGIEIPDHLHHYFQFDVILEGEVTVRIEGHPCFRAKPGNCWLLPPLLRHGYRARRQFRQASFKFYIAPRFWTRFSGGFRKAPLPVLLLKTLEYAACRAKKSHPFCPQEAAAVLTLCLIQIAPPAEAPVGGKEMSDPFRAHLWLLLERISQAPFDDWSVKRMASACHLSVDHFTRKFVRVFTLLPRDYLSNARLRATATELLDHPSVAIKEVAERSGYSTVHSFTRAFTRAMKVSPAAYRRQPRVL